MNAICTLLISVVRRVTSDEVENLSIFAKENRCTREKISWRIFFARPADAFEQVKPAKPPHASEIS